LNHNSKQKKLNKMIMNKLYIYTCAGWLALTGAVRAGDDLAKTFATPPVESRAWCYWWWLNGNASKEGITRDFEEMRRKGISGALLFDAGYVAGDPQVPQGPPFMSPAWRELFKHAVREADRCGIVLTVNLCSGWDCGGPWVTQEHAAKQLVSSQMRVKGPGPISAALPKPAAVQQGYYRDIAVLAAPAGGYKLTASSCQPGYPPELAEDGDDNTRWISQGTAAGMGPTPEKPEFLLFDCDDPRSAAGIWLKPYPDCGPAQTEVQCSDDGSTFRPLQRVTLKPGEETIIGFAETRAKYFRVVFLSAHPFRGGNWNVQVSEIALMIKDQVTGKQRPAPLRWNHAAVVDLAKFVAGNGQLDWDAPAGAWKIMRIGCTLTGLSTSNPGSGPAGPEIDPMSAEALDLHFAETGAKLIADAGPLAGKALQYLHIDSWEIGQPNWTPKMREEFQKRRGYDPLFWMPAVLGMPVDSQEETEKFMRDYRRTVADLVAENYYGRLNALSVKGGLKGAHSEAGGPIGCHFFWGDALRNLGVNAIPMGEFWKRNSEPDGDIFYGPYNHTIREAASAAHIYGKPVCQAEAFTSFGLDWCEAPWDMKDLGDAAFCDGLTRMVFHHWAHQPFLDAKPGFQWGHVGTHYDSNLTWWPMAEGWLAYLTRCQHLLRQGLFVGDFAYLQTEDIPSFAARKMDQQPMRPVGFDYDAMSADALIARASAKDGRLVLPDGMSYRYLVLPHGPNAFLTTATLKKVNELAEAGVTVVGPAIFGAAVTKLRQDTLDAIVKADGVLPDIEIRNPGAGTNFDWIHRRNGGVDVYFISHQTPNRKDDVTTEITFRVAGKRPELWDAVTGKTRELVEYKTTEDGRTVVPLTFAPRQSWFVVFRKDVATAKDAKDWKGARNFPELKAMMTLTGAWDVQFDAQWFYPDNGTGGKMRFEQLTDWTTHPEAAVKYYSGIAVYRKTFDCPPPATRTPVLSLDLGEVKNLARVKLNGRDLGIVWTAPWQVEIPRGLIQEKGNALEIEVANLWPNRLVGDATLPPDQRRTRTNVVTYKAEKKGFRSGLLGPVQVLERAQNLFNP